MAGAESLRGRVALVTGASGGIGGAVARGLAGEGVASALSYRASAEPAERLAGEIESAGGRAVAIGADLARAEAAAELVDAVEQSLGPIDVLVPAAGVGEVRALDEVSVEELDRTFAVNLRAPFLLAQRTVPGMRRRGFGRVLFISSIAALTGGVVGPHYASSKAALHGLTHFLAARTAADGVTVNALAPALITNTRMLPDEPDELKDRVPVGRLGTPEEVADLALATLRNRYITNQVISIDGGMYPR
jgi:3-oxoacyl-[acyl-carrier protein] reductase